MFIQVKGEKLEAIRKLLETQVLFNPIVNAMVSKFTPLEEAKIIRKEDGLMYVYYFGKATQADAAVLKTRGFRIPKTTIDAIEQTGEPIEGETPKHAHALTVYAKTQTTGASFEVGETDKLYIISNGRNPRYRTFLLQKKINGEFVDNGFSESKRLNVTPVKFKQPVEVPVIPLGTVEEMKAAIVKLIEPEGEFLFPEDIILSTTDFKEGYGYTAKIGDLSLKYEGNLSFKVGPVVEGGDDGEEPTEPEIPFPLQDVNYSDVKWVSNTAKLNTTAPIPNGHTLAINAGLYKPQEGQTPDSFTYLADYISWLNANNRDVVTITSTSEPHVNGGYEFSLNDATKIFATPTDGGYSRYLNVLQFDADGIFVAAKEIDGGGLFNPLNPINDFPQVYKQLIGNTKLIGVAENEWVINGAGVINSRLLQHAAGFENLEGFNGYCAFEVTNLTELRLTLGTVENKFRFIQIPDVNLLPVKSMFVIGNSVTLPVAQDLGTTEVQVYGSSSSNTSPTFDFNAAPSTAALEELISSFFEPDTLLWDLAGDGLTCTVLNLSNDYQWIKLINGMTGKIIAWFYLSTAQD